MDFPIGIIAQILKHWRARYPTNILLQHNESEGGSYSRTYFIDSSRNSEQHTKPKFPKEVLESDRNDK